MQTVTSPTLPSSEGDGSVGAAKWHSAVCAHLFCTVSFSLDVNMVHSTKTLNIMAVNLLGFTVLKHTDTNTHAYKVASEPRPSTSKREIIVRGRFR